MSICIWERVLAEVTEDEFLCDIEIFCAAFNTERLDEPVVA